MQVQRPVTEKKKVKIRKFLGREGGSWRLQWPVPSVAGLLLCCHESTSDRDESSSGEVDLSEGGSFGQVGTGGGGGGAVQGRKGGAGRVGMTFWQHF